MISQTALQIIHSRRSVRHYRPDPVSEADIQVVLEAAMSAPSAGNQQPWDFVVITERRLMDEFPRFHPHAQMMKEAPLAILICADLKRESHPGFWVQDCSAAAQNILLAVVERGLGAVWVGIYPRGERVEGVRKLFDLPDYVMPFCVIPIGVPSEEAPPVSRFDGAKVHRNRW